MTPQDPHAGLGPLLAEGAAALRTAGLESADLDAEVLLAHCMGLDRGQMLLTVTLRPDQRVPAGVEAAFRAQLERRAGRVPVAYLTGVREFWSLELEVTPDVLIPRPETELLVREALACLGVAGSPRSPIVDVGTGSGAVAVALARELPGAAVVATDLSWSALQVARRNTRRHGVSERVALVQGDLLEMIAGPVALVAANPPYIAHHEREAMMPEVRDHEPAGALFAGPTGMEAIEPIVARAGRLLAPGGWLVMEIDSRRGGQVESLLARDAIWQNVRVRDDYAGLPRVARARRGP